MRIFAKLLTIHSGVGALNYSLVFFYKKGLFHVGLALTDGLDIALSTGFLGGFLADTRDVGNLVTAVNGLPVIFAGSAGLGVQRTLMMLVNQEVGNRRLDLERSRLRDRATANMNLHSGIISPGHIADFLASVRPPHKHRSG